ncbi:Multidrug resistance-associated protein 9 [Plecturocebus cupreus]
MTPSAMDAHLGKHVFEERIKTTLRGKTMVLKMERFVKREATELMEERGHYAKPIHKLQGLQFEDPKHLYNAAMVEVFRESPAERGEDADTIVPVHQLIQIESPWEGTVTWKTCHTYIRLLEGIPLLLSCVPLPPDDRQLCSVTCGWVSGWTRAHG